MTAAELQKLFPQISKSCLQENLPAVSTQLIAKKPVAGRTGSGMAQFHEQDNRTESPRETPKLECPTGNGALGAHQGQEAGSGRLHIRFESVRKRLLDPDNIAEKWLLDALRFSGTLQGDEPDKITLETTQRKCEKGEEEHTLIQIFEP